MSIEAIVLSLHGKSKIMLTAVRKYSKLIVRKNKREPPTSKTELQKPNVNVVPGICKSFVINVIKQ